jgi:hypothetical protein
MLPYQQQHHGACHHSARIQFFSTSLNCNASILLSRPMASSKEVRKEDRITPLNQANRLQNLPPTPKGLRSWRQPIQQNVKPLSPNSKPALVRQRDHSACRRPDTPLRVRKTRENLKKDGGLGDVPPPCVGCTGSEEAVEPSRTVVPNDTPLPVSSDKPGAHNLQIASPEPMLLHPLSPDAKVEQAKVNRHRSVSNRVMSSLKSAAARTRSSRTIRPMESESSLLRRMSGRRKPTAETQPERRAYSFDVSRDSVASEVDIVHGSSADAISHGNQALEHRSFTDSTVSTTALVEELDPVTPPFDAPTPERVVFKNRFSSAPESPPPRHPAGFDRTPRPVDRVARSTSDHAVRRMTVPCVRLDVAMDADFLDFGESSNMWVAIEAIVETHVVEIPAEG